jgi:hypothetical protein
MTSVFYVRYDPRTEEVLDVIDYLEVRQLVIDELDVFAGIEAQDLNVEGTGTFANLTVTTNLTSEGVTDLDGVVNANSVLKVDTLQEKDGETEIAVASDVVFDDGMTLRLDTVQVDDELWLPPTVEGNADVVTEFVGEYDHQDSIWVGLPDLTPTVRITGVVIANSVYTTSAAAPSFILDLIKFKVNGEDWVRAFFHDFNLTDKLADAAAVTFSGFGCNSIIPAGYRPKHIQAGFTTICEIYRPPLIPVSYEGVSSLSPSLQAAGQTFLTHIKIALVVPVIALQIIGADATSTRPVGSMFKIPDGEFSYRAY